MTKEKFQFSKSKNKEVEGIFAGGNVTQDAGLLTHLTHMMILSNYLALIKQLG